MRRLFSLCFALLLGLTAAAEDRVSWEITPRITAPGQPFRLQIIVESDVVLGGAQQAGKEIRPPRGMALRLSGQIVRSDSNEATINYSGVAPEQEGEYIIPAFNLRFARKMIAVEPIKLTVSKSVAYRRTAQARAELAIPDRTFYVGELIRGSIRMRGGEDETVVASFGLESVAEGFTLSVTADRQPLPEELGQGMQTTFELTPIREGVSELALNGTMLIQGAAVSAFSNRRNLHGCKHARETEINQAHKHLSVGALLHQDVFAFDVAMDDGDRVQVAGGSRKLQHDAASSRLGQRLSKRILREKRCERTASERTCNAQLQRLRGRRLPCPSIESARNVRMAHGAHKAHLSEHAAALLAVTHVCNTFDD